MTNIADFNLLKKHLKTKGVAVDKDVDGFFLHVNGETFKLSVEEIKLC